MNAPEPRIVPPSLPWVAGALVVVAVVLPFAAQGLLVGLADVDAMGPSDARRLAAAGAVVVDVRTAGEFAGGDGVAGSRHWPLGEVLACGRVEDVPTDLRGRRLLMVCTVGARSLLATRRLRELGVAAANVEGGLVAWHARPAALSGAAATCGWALRWVLAPAAALAVVSMVGVRRRAGKLAWLPALALSASAMGLSADVTGTGATADWLWTVVVQGQAVALGWLGWVLLRRNAARGRRRAAVTAAGAALLSGAALCLPAAAAAAAGGLLGTGGPFSWSWFRPFLAGHWVAHHGLLMALLAAGAAVAGRTLEGPWVALFAAAGAGPATLALANGLVGWAAGGQPAVFVALQVATVPTVAAVVTAVDRATDDR